MAHHNDLICKLSHAANVRLIAAAPSMYDALWAIANMQVQEETDKGEVLALCMSIARLELEKCSVDHLADPMAAGAWQDGPAPKDGSHILALFRGDPYVVYWDSWQTGETIPGEGTYIDGEESGWIIARNGDDLIDDEPEKWARIIHPDRHMPASWDGPGDLG